MPYSSLKTATIDREMPLVSQIYEILLNLIVCQELRPGSPLKIDLISQALGVSRTPVNEAIAKLTEDRLVEVFPQRGTFVSKIRVQDVREGAFIRRALEVATAKHVAEHHNAQMIKALDLNLRYQKASLEADDLETFYELDEEFHNLLCEFTGFPRLKRIIRGPYAQLARVRKLLLPTPGRPQDTYQEHLDIFEAIKDSQGDLAGAEMLKHVNQVPNQLDTIYGRYPDLFVDEV